MSEEQRKREEFASMKAAMYGLAGVCVLLLIESLKDPKPDQTLTIAIYCFAAAIPLLISFGIIVDLWLRSGKEEMEFPALGYFMGALSGSYAGVGGVIAYLWHYKATVAVVFICAIVGGIVAFFGFQNNIHASERSKEDEGLS